MRNLFKALVLCCLLLSLRNTQALCQDDNDDVHNLIINLPEVALLDLEAAGAKDISLGPDAPTEAGEALDFSNESNSELWINHSSIVGAKSDPKKNITVQITSGALPSAMLLSVVVHKDAGAGDGTIGTPTTSLVLNNKAQNIITGLGSAYTGNGPTRGHRLTYSLAFDTKKGAHTNLDFDRANTLTITYTLSDQ